MIQEQIDLSLETETIEKTLSIIELIKSGGLAGQLIIALLTFLLVVTLYIYIERLLTIKAASNVDPNFMNEIKDCVINGNFDAAKSLCMNVNSPVSRLIHKGVSRIGRPLADINSSLAISVISLGPSVTITLVLQFTANASAATLEDKNVWFNMRFASSRFT